MLTSFVSNPTGKEMAGIKTLSKQVVSWHFKQ